MPQDQHTRHNHKSKVRAEKLESKTKNVMNLHQKPDGDIEVLSKILLLKRLQKLGSNGEFNNDRWPINRVR